jgi:hypothetical protein
VINVKAEPTSVSFTGNTVFLFADKDVDETYTFVQDPVAGPYTESVTDIT